MDRASADQPGLTFRQPLYSLQAGRAFAAIAVLLLHADRIIDLPKYGATTFAYFWFSSGRLGVDFFFVLSGFIICHAHGRDIGRPARLGPYLLRRAMRIYPIYWVVLSLSLAALLVMGHRFGVLDLLRNYSLFDVFERDRIVAVAWTLFHESLFYLAFAALILNRWLGGIVFALWMIAVLWFQGAPGTPQAITDPINLCFAAGMAACALAHRLPPRVFALPLLIGAAGLLYVAGTTHAQKLESAPDGYLSALFCGLVIMGLAMADLAKVWRVPRVLVFLGAASYSIYLVQFAALSLACRALLAAGVLAWMPPTATIPLLVACGIAAGGALYWAVERPILQRLRSKTAGKAPLS